MSFTTVLKTSNNMLALLPLKRGQVQLAYSLLLPCLFQFQILMVLSILS